ncbi:unnamed protein product [Effrenium voratum]|nr:unnamed protein product [Effrenium voratum]
MELQLLAALAAFESCLLAFLEKSPQCLSNFQARKICHAGTGLMLLQLDSREVLARYFVYAIGVISLAMIWEVHPKLHPFRFGKSRDIGMTVYLVVAMLWFSLQLPIHVLGPMFFADPMGAVVGKYLSSMKDKGIVNPVWWTRGGVTKTLARPPTFGGFYCRCAGASFPRSLLSLQRSLCTDVLRARRAARWNVVTWCFPRVAATFCPMRSGIFESRLRQIPVPRFVNVLPVMEMSSCVMGRVNAPTVTARFA